MKAPCRPDSKTGMADAILATPTAESPPRRVVHRGRDAEAPRVLFMGEAVALSHVARPALLARHLADRGYSVCFARNPRYNHLVESFNILRVDLALRPDAVGCNPVNPSSNVQALEQSVREDLEILREFQADVVVGDFRFSLAASARLAGVPYVSIVDAYWSPSADIEIEFPGSAISRIIGAPLSDLLFKVIHPIEYALYTVPINTILQKYGLPQIAPNIRAYLCHGDYTLHPSDAALYPFRKPLPFGHAFIGPLLWSPQVPTPAWWSHLPNLRPIVYVSLGSTGEPSLLEAIFRVLGGLPLTVIAATAGRDEPKRVPTNVFLAEFMPGAKAARRSRFVICNGGAMSGQQALSEGTPYLGLISNVDQMLYSRAVQREGACELLRASDVTEASLRALVQALLAQEKYRVAAQRIARRMASHDSCLAFEQFLNSRFPVQIGSAQATPKDGRK